MEPTDHCDFSPRDFSATAIETSDGRLVHVNGSGLCPTGGWELRLVAANPGVVPHPEILRLELRERPPLHATHAPATTSVDAVIEDTRAERIEILFGWRGGFVIPVRTPTRPRAAGRGGRARADAASGRAVRRGRRERADAASARVTASGRVAASAV
ncbi:hypothetical protein ACFWN7_07575 [Agromyces sp. NPDC058484]|uniref:hypothetical protein n=1 Tax=Agromyces sp. NPDC058484 TaxID=3346524 RepID=UPI00365DF665